MCHIWFSHSLIVLQWTLRKSSALDEHMVIVFRILQMVLEKIGNKPIGNGVILNNRQLHLQFVFDLRRKPSLGWRELLAKDVLTSWLEKASSGRGIARPLPFASPSAHSLSGYRELSDIPERVCIAGRKDDPALAPRHFMSSWDMEFGGKGIVLPLPSASPSSHSSQWRKEQQLSNQNISDIHFLGR